MQGKETFQGLTSTLGALLIFEWAGLFNGVNDAVNSAIPFWAPARAITNTGSMFALVFYLTVLLAIDVKRTGHADRTTVSAALAFFLTAVVVALLKPLFAVPRPGETAVSWGLVERLENISYFAFPSGHTARAAVLAYFLGRRWRKGRPLWWGWALGVALSRLLLHAHWLSDVMFSLLLGPWVGMLTILTEDWWLPYYRAMITRLKLEVLDVE